MPLLEINQRSSPQIKSVRFTPKRCADCSVLLCALHRFAVRIAPYYAIEHLHRKYEAQEMYYEVQVWDYELLKKMRYMVLGEGEAC